MIVSVLSPGAKASPQREKWHRNECKESIVWNVPFKLDVAGLKEKELAGNYKFLLSFLFEIFLLHTDILKLSLRDSPNPVSHCALVPGVLSCLESTWWNPTNILSLVLCLFKIQTNSNGFYLFYLQLTVNALIKIVHIFVGHRWNFLSKLQCLVWENS